MKIVAIDFETANKSAHSACSLGYAVYEDGVITKSGSFLILPPKDVRYFTFSFIHHLSLEDVRNQEEVDKHYDFVSELFKEFPCSKAGFLSKHFAVRELQNATTKYKALEFPAKNFF